MSRLTFALTTLLAALPAGALAGGLIYAIITGLDAFTSSPLLLLAAASTAIAAVVIFLLPVAVMLGIGGIGAGAAAAAGAASGEETAADYSADGLDVGVDTLDITDEADFDAENFGESTFEEDFGDDEGLYDPEQFGSDDFDEFEDDDADDGKA
ncbi:MAG: hypothetical protein AAF532_04695 [Planctomycetota bacterium]